MLIETGAGLLEVDDMTSRDGPASYTIGGLDFRKGYDLDLDDSGQTGINCAAFRNESQLQSSDLIRQADAIADCLWPGSRHYTYVDSQAVRSRNPGYCFIAAGWRRCGRTKGGLVILERTASPKARDSTYQVGGMSRMDAGDAGEME